MLAVALVAGLGACELAGEAEAPGEPLGLVLAPADGLPVGLVELGGLETSGDEMGVPDDVPDGVVDGFPDVLGFGVGDLVGALVAVGVVGAEFDGQPLTIAASTTMAAARQ